MVDWTHTANFVSFKNPTNKYYSKSFLKIYKEWEKEVKTNHEILEIGRKMKYIHITEYYIVVEMDKLQC